MNSWVDPFDPNYGGAAGDDAHDVSEAKVEERAKMSDHTKPARVSRRTVLIAAAGAVPLLALVSD